MGVGRPGNSTGMRSKLRSSFGYLLYLSAVATLTLAALWALRWVPLVSELRARRRPASEQLKLVPHVDLELMKLLGHVKADKRSSFSRFDVAKKPGVIRLCAFGDSYTHGDEVNGERDYPTLLQAQLERAGYENVEVLNFGAASHGFHQAYLMWEAQSERFGCDCVLLGPQCFQSKRDTRFNHSDLDEPYYLHSRFILVDGRLRRMDVRGNTYTERFDDYFRFFPRWRYLRYERSAPPALLSVVRRGRTLDNPLYYRSDTADEEARATYRILLRRLAERSHQVVLTHGTPEIVALARALGLANLSAAPMHRKIEFPYMAPEGHNSGLGNVLVARQYLAALSGATQAELTVLVSTDPEIPRRWPKSTRHDLSSFDRIEVRVGDQPLGYFFSPYYQPVYADLQGSDVDSLLAVKNPSTSLVDAFFVPLQFYLHDRMEVTLKVRTARGEEDYDLGRVRLIDPRVNVGVVDIQGIEYRRRRRGNKLYFIGNDALPWRRIQGATRVALNVGDKEILKGYSPLDRVTFEIKHEEFGKDGFYELRAAAHHFVDVDTLPESGHYDLYLQHAEDGEIRVPIGRWTKQALAVPVEPAPEPLSRSARSARFVPIQK